MIEQIKVELVEWMGNDFSIANSAWTSSIDNKKKQDKTNEDIEKLINTLADSGHGVPFESIIFKFWMKLPISADRHIITHRLASHSGMSRTI